MGTGHDSNNQGTKITCDIGRGDRGANNGRRGTGRGRFLSSRGWSNNPGGVGLVVRAFARGAGRIMTLQTMVRSIIDMLESHDRV